jgi:hypothetical protein
MEMHVDNYKLYKLFKHVIVPAKIIACVVILLIF